MGVLFYLRSDRHYILVSAAILAVFFLIIILCDVLIDSGRSFLLKVNIFVLGRLLLYCIAMLVFYYDMYSFTRAIPHCLVSISCHMYVNRYQLTIVVVIDW